MDLNSGMICQVALISSVHPSFGFHVISKIADKNQQILFCQQKPSDIGLRCSCNYKLVHGTFFWLNAYIPPASCSTSCCHKFEIPTKWMESSLASVTWVCLAGLTSRLNVFNWRCAREGEQHDNEIILFTYDMRPRFHPFNKNAYIYYIYRYINIYIYTDLKVAFSCQILAKAPACSSNVWVGRAFC